MATTGLADSAVGKYDAITPPKASSLPSDLVSQLLINLNEPIKALKAKKEGGLDLEGLLEFQRVANYLYVCLSSCCSITLSILILSSIYLLPPSDEAYESIQSRWEPS